MGVSGGAPKNPTSDIILPARFNEHGSEALRWIFGIDRMRDSNDARTFVKSGRSSLLNLMQSSNKFLKLLGMSARSLPKSGFR